ncbi:MAG: hypothetical protein WCH42_02910 [Actinomycetes bacterium]
MNLRLKNFLLGHQGLIEKLWASTIVLYSFVATLVVWKTLHKYGVSPILFFVIDVCTSWPYGIATARIVAKVLEKDWKQVRKWSWIAAICFVTPQIYILVASHHAPRDVYVIVIAVCITMIIFALASLWIQIRRVRR